VTTGSTTAATSPDGVTWTVRTLPSSSSWTSVTYGNGVFVAVTTGSTTAATSPDGVTWTARTLPSSSNWTSVTYGNGLFVAVAGGPSTVAATSGGALTFSGDFTAPRTVTFPDAAVSIPSGTILTGTLTTGRVALSGGVGVVTDSANLTFNGTALVVGTDPGGSELVRAGGNVRLGNSVGSTATPNYLRFSQDYSNSSTAASCKMFLYSATSVETYGIGLGSSSDIQYHSGGATKTAGVHRFYTGEVLRLTISDSAVVIGTDPGGSELLRVGGAIRISSATMIATSTSFTNGAGAGAGTITNAPAAGNPTKWIPINDNGTTRYIPAW
jgi:hypothetical protein